MRVRQALLYALNKEEFNQAAYLDKKYYETPYSFLPVANPYVTEDVEKYEQNIEKAKQLLAEAGVSNLTVNLGYSSSDAAQTLQTTLIQQQLAAIGVAVELAGGDSTALFTELKKKVLQHMTSSWVATSQEMTLISMLVCLKLVVLQITLNWRQARLTISLNKVLLNWIKQNVSKLRN